MDKFTLHQLLCLDAVVTEGSFQAAAAKLHRTHPSVFTAIKNLESHLGLALLDRKGYRVTLTPAGRSFHERAQALLRDVRGLRDHAAQLAMGEEGELRIVIGDVTPIPEAMGLLRRFTKSCPSTQLNLFFEALSGPWERLLDGEADLIVHHIDKSDPRLEYLDLYQGAVIPVVAPGFLDFPVTDAITPEQMLGYVQCVIRDSARHAPPLDYHLIEGTRRCTVGDQLMKKEIILQGMGWGHMPTFMVAEELRTGRLVSIAGKYLRGGSGELVAARRRDTPHGPVANRLWRYIGEQAPEFGASIRRRTGSGLRAGRDAAP